MISAIEYDDKLTQFLIKNESTKNNKITFFTDLIYKITTDLSFSQIKNIKNIKQDIISIMSTKNNPVQLEGKRNAFSLYIYDNAKKKKYYMNAVYYPNTKKYVYSLNTSTKTFYSIIKYQNYPIIKCNDTMQKNLLIIKDNMFTHTNNYNEAVKQSTRNFFYFNDTITTNKIKQYKTYQIYKYIIYTGTGIFVLILLYYVFIYTSPKKYHRYDDDDDDDY